MNVNGPRGDPFSGTAPPWTAANGGRLLPEGFPARRPQHPLVLPFEGVAVLAATDSHNSGAFGPRPPATAPTPLDPARCRGQAPVWTARFPTRWPSEAIRRSRCGPSRSSGSGPATPAPTPGATVRQATPRRGEVRRGILERGREPSPNHVVRANETFRPPVPGVLQLASALQFGAQLVSRFALHAIGQQGRPSA